MPKLHGKNTQLLVGPYDPSNWFNSSEQTRERDIEEATGFRPPGDAKQYVAGNTDSTLSLSGMFDGDEEAVDEQMEAQLASDDADFITWAPDGLDAGKRGRMMQVKASSYVVTSPLDGVVSLSVEFQNDGAMVIGPVVLSPNVASTGFGDLPAVSAHQDLGAAPLDSLSAPIYHGAVLHLHVLANTLDESVDVVIEHSGDTAGPWVALDTVAVAAGTTAAQRIDVAKGTTLDRYVRATIEATGAAPTVGAIQASLTAGRLPR